MRVEYSSTFNGLPRVGVYPVFEFDEADDN